MRKYGSNCTPYHATATNTIDGDLTSGVQSWSYSDSNSSGCAVLYEVEEIASNPNASFFATWSIDSNSTT